MSAAEARERGDPYERRDGRDGVGGGVVGGQSSGGVGGGQQSTSGKLFKGLAHVVPDFGLGGRPHDGQQQPHQQQQQSSSGGTLSFMQKLNDLTHHNPINNLTHHNPVNNTAVVNQPQHHQQQQQQQQPQPDHGVDNILSKGKELIFMKFGLGKWCLPMTIGVAFTAHIVNVMIRLTPI